MSKNKPFKKFNEKELQSKRIRRSKSISTSDGTIPIQTNLVPSQPISSLSQLPPDETEFYYVKYKKRLTPQQLNEEKS